MKRTLCWEPNLDSSALKSPGLNSADQVWRGAYVLQLPLQGALGDLHRDWCHSSALLTAPHSPLHGIVKFYQGQLSLFFPFSAFSIEIFLSYKFFPEPLRFPLTQLYGLFFSLKYKENQNNKHAKKRHTQQLYKTTKLKIKIKKPKTSNTKKMHWKSQMRQV